MSQTRRPDPPCRFSRDVLPLCEQLHARARRLTSKPADAEDLVQETLLRAFVGFDGFQEGTNLRAWLFTVMNHTWISKYRAAQRRPEERLTGDVSEAGAALRGLCLATTLRSAEAEVLDAMPDGQIAEALRQLPAEARTTIYLADVHGLRHNEIARVMDTPIATVTSRLHRGRRKLRQLLSESQTECQAS